MESAFDTQINYLHEILKQSFKDSQYLNQEITTLKDQLDTLHKSVEHKFDATMNEIEPRIEQLEQRIEFYWGSVEGKNAEARKELENEKKLFKHCKALVGDMEKRTQAVDERV